MKRVLVVRTDGLGDVVLTGPAVRAVAASGAHVTMLCAPSNTAAARRLPGVARVMTANLPWIDAEPAPVTRGAVRAVRERIAVRRFDEAVIFTSFHQSPLPTALVLRLAGVPRIGAISTDYPGSLLDVRHVVDDGVHEVERNLSLARAMGYAPRADDDGSLQLSATTNVHPLAHPYVVVHPGASAPARTLSPAQWRAVVAGLVAAGRSVVITGRQAESALLEAVAGEEPGPIATMASDDFDVLIAITMHADAVVVGNTGPAHVAAALGTPVVSCFAPTVPATRWRPWAVPHLLLGDQDVTCAGCRARVCPCEQQLCLSEVGADDVVAALDSLTGTRPRAVPA